MLCTYVARGVYLPFKSAGQVPLGLGIDAGVVVAAGAEGAGPVTVMVTVTGPGHVWTDAAGG